MPKFYQPFLPKLIIGGLLALFLSVNIFPRLYHNGSGSGYNESGTTESSYGTANAIEIYVEEAAGHFFNAYAEILRFSNRFELQDQKGFDFNEWRLVLGEAANHTKKAITVYRKLIETAEKTPYNWRVIYQLWFFDYNTFMRINRLNPTIFEGVAYYLSMGDITGFYMRTYDRLNRLEGMIEALLKDVSLNQMPPLKEIWKLNEYFSETLTAGQYVARVFYEIR